MPQTKTRTETLFVRLTDQDKAHVQELATELGVSLSAAAVIMIRRYVELSPKSGGLTPCTRDQ